MSTQPALSVVMPAYNAEAHLAEAVESVLGQSFGDFELIVVNDGSNDKTDEILGRVHDPRLRVIRHERNLGLIAALHRGLAEAHGGIIARMDADDICRPDRFALQMRHLDTHADVDIVGGAIRFFGSISQPTVYRFPEQHAAIEASMLFICALPHPALVFRRRLVDDGQMHFDDGFRHAEDYELWTRILRKVKAANLPDVLVDYRLHSKQVSSGSTDHQYEASRRVRERLFDGIGAAWSPADAALHESVILERTLAGPDYLARLSDWFARLKEANRRSGYFEPAALGGVLDKKLLEVKARHGRSAISRAARFARRGLAFMLSGRVFDRLRLRSGIR